MVQFIPNPVSLLERFGQFLAKRQIEKAQAEVAAVLARIDRRFGMSDAPIDVQEFLVPAADIPVKVTGAKSYDDDSFYALDPAEGSGWTYQLSNEAELIFDQLEIEGPIEGLDTEFLSDFPVHTWQNDAVFLTDNVGFRRMRPTISVQRLPHPRMVQTISMGLEKGVQSASEPLSEEEVQTIRQLLEEQYYRDPTGVFLGNLLKQLTGLGPDVFLVLDSIRRSGTSMDARFTLILYDATVNEKHHKHFYLVYRNIALYTPGSLWIVRTIVPTANRLSDHYEWVTRWMSAFAIPFS